MAWRGGVGLQALKVGMEGDDVAVLCQQCQGCVKGDLVLLRAAGCSAAAMHCSDSMGFFLPPLTAVRSITAMCKKINCIKATWQLD